MTTVILAPNWLGDAVMALPAMRALRQGLPGRCIVVARPPVRDVVRTTGAQVWVYRPSLLGTGRLIHSVRRLKPDAVVSFLRSRRAGLITATSGAPLRVGWDAGPARRAYSVRAPSDRKRIHQVDEYLRLPKALGLPAPAVWPPREALAPEPGPEAIVMAPGSSFGPAKRWPAPHYASLARLLRDRTGLPILVVGSSREASTLKEVVDRAGRGVENLAGRTSLPELAALVRGCRLFVGNDSGVAHLGAWMGAPVVVVFGSTDPRWTRPIGPRVHVVYRHEPCSPCFRRSCPLGHTNCLVRVSPQEVEEVCVGMLERGQSTHHEGEDASGETV